MERFGDAGALDGGTGLSVRLDHIRVLVPVMICLCACGGAKVERRGDPQQRVISRIYSTDLTTLRKAVLEKFKQARNESIPFHSMNVIELKPPNYPPEWAASFVDPGGFLEPYKGTDAAVRGQDLLIEEATGDVYWPSEYKTAAGPVKFRCGFIVHFEQRASHSTEVQVYEKGPEVWVGEHLDFLHEGIGIGKVHDIRFVEPTVKDRLELLDALDQIAVMK